MAKIFEAGPTNYLAQPMFLGEDVSTARYDVQTHPMFEELIDKQLGFFWRPNEVNISKDKHDFENLTDAERHIFVENLKYQILLDSIQGRSPNLAFLEICSIPELETWIETWSFSETIHSRSYTHIIRSIVNDPSEILDDVTVNPAISARAEAFTKHYEELIDANTRLRNLKNAGEAQTDEGIRLHKYLILKTMVVVNALEAIAFYVSFACSFAFGERGVMVGNANIIKLIARDEALHLRGTEYIINTLRKDPEYAEIWEEHKNEFHSLFISAAENEKRWAEYLFSKGTTLGLNREILCVFVEYITNARMSTVGLGVPYPDSRENPLPWIYQSSWLSSDNVQVAPQEDEITDYLTGGLDENVNDSDLDDLEF